MTTPENRTWPWRRLWLLPITLIAAATLVACGGGGGGDGGGSNGGGIDDGGDDPGPVNILPTYNFLLANVPGDNLLTASINSGISVSIDIDGLLHNSLDLSVSTSNEVTMLSYTIRAGSRIDVIVSSDGILPLDGTTAVTVTEDVEVSLGSPPSSGAFDVVVPGETVSVAVTPFGVQLSLNGGAPVDYSWDEFGGLMEDDTYEVWVRRASLASDAFEFLYDFSIDAGDILDDLELLATNNPLVEPCDMFTGTPPAGVLAQGEMTLTWTGAGEVSPGDDFVWQFNQCWFDEPGEPIDELFNGTVTLENYTETVDFNTNTLFEIGFGSLSGNPGGIMFDLTLSGTVENNGVFTISPDNVIAITGGFAMIIQAP
jgi:hypothetical protein